MTEYTVTFLRWLKRYWFWCLLTVLGIIALILFLRHIAATVVLPPWSGFEDKTLWDVIELIIIPVVLLIGGYFFSRAEHKAGNKIADERQQEAALQIYLDRMTELLIENGLDTSEADSEQSGVRRRAIARARTLTILRQFSSERKGLLIRFLYQSKLIAKGKPVIDLSGADLSKANLSGSDLGSNRDKTFLSYLSLSEAQLCGVNLTGANLSEAKLSEANLVMADLTKANLTNANLMFADLRCATMTGADLYNANLIGANLSAATGLTQKQLRQASSIKGATLPDGTKVE
jgi:uncharacterized protein YjbI with pentapeptide repeats